jgi:hypothetical protein
MISGTASLYSYYLRIELEKLGISTVPCPCPSQNAPDEEYIKLLNNMPHGDHIISVEQRGFYNRKRIQFLMSGIRKKIAGKITTICDNNQIVGFEDMVYYAVPDKERKGSKYVGWAADPQMCYPEQNPNTIRILIDHSYYGSPDKNPDRSEDIIRQTIAFAKNYKEKPLLVRRFICGGVETLSLDNPKFEIYNRNGLYYPDACAEYRKSDIFIVTHAESMGLSVLESAMSGALILSPKSFIRKSLLEPLHHIEFSKEIPWDQVKNSLDANRSFKNASKFSWQKIAKDIATDLYG